MESTAQTLRHHHLPAYYICSLSGRGREQQSGMEQGSQGAGKSRWAGWKFVAGWQVWVVHAVQRCSSSGVPVARPFVKMTQPTCDLSSVSVCLQPSRPRMAFSQSVPYAGLRDAPPILLPSFFLVSFRKLPQVYVLFSTIGGPHK